MQGPRNLEFGTSRPLRAKTLHWVRYSSVVGAGTKTIFAFDCKFANGRHLSVCRWNDNVLEETVGTSVHDCLYLQRPPYLFLLTVGGSDLSHHGQQSLRR